jgi:hypothetical protein
MEPQEPNTEAGLHTEQAEGRYKTLGVRLGEELHAQLSFIAQLKGTTITEEIRQSIEARVVAAQDDPELITRAETVRSQIEREAEARRQAIAGFFGNVGVEAVTAEPGPDRPGRRRRNGATSDS